MDNAGMQEEKFNMMKSNCFCVKDDAGCDTDRASPKV